MAHRTIVSVALLGTAALAGAVALASSRQHLGGVEDAEVRYSVVFPLEEARPNPRLTPGAVNPAVTQANVRETICSRGYSKRIRPPRNYTERLKRRQVREYGYTDRRLPDYEEDHLVSLGIGGSPTDPRNLWPEPRHVLGGWGSDAKDRLEDRLHTAVCRRELPLAEAQRAMAIDWIAAYKRYVAVSVALLPDPHSGDVAGGQPIRSEMLLDRHRVARTKPEPAGCPVGLLPDLAIVEVQHQLVRSGVDAHDSR